LFCRGRSSSFKRRDAGQGLRRIGRLLQQLQPAAILQYGAEIGLAHHGACLRESRFLFFGLALSLVGIRPQQNRGSVRIGDEVACDQSFEIALAGSHPGLDRGQRCIEREPRQRVTAVEPVVQRAEQDRDAAWE